MPEFAIMGPMIGEGMVCVPVYVDAFVGGGSVSDVTIVERSGVGGVCCSCDDGAAVGKDGDFYVGMALDGESCEVGRLDGLSDVVPAGGEGLEVDGAGGVGGGVGFWWRDLDCVSAADGGGVGCVAA